MKKVLIFLIMFIPVVALSQKTVKLKKKYFGTYKGTIPAYKMDAGDQLVEVSESAILIEIGKEDVTIAIGKNILHGTYKVLFMAKTYYLLDVNVDNQLASERILVYKRGKRLSRDGMFPQPVAELKKFK